MNPRKIKTNEAKKDKDWLESFRPVKGTRDLGSDTWHEYQGFMEKAAEIALYYGFRPIETPLLEREELFRRTAGEHTDIVNKEMYPLRTKGGDHLVLRPEGTAPTMRAYFSSGMQSLPQPVMLYYAGPFFRHDNPQHGRWRQFWQFGLEIIGSAKSVNDTLIIKLTLTALEEAGVDDLMVRLNSLGDNVCRLNYRRELVVYYRKHSRELCNDCRERLKFNPLRLLDCKALSCVALKENAPASVSFLCHDCKNHFREVLEHLDSLGVSYSIDHTLVRGLDYYSRTVFEISGRERGDPKENNQSEPLALASGGRYDYLARLIGSKKDVPAVGVAIGVDRVVELAATKKLSPRIIKTPKIFFIQLGFEAKLKSLTVIETLRRAHIPITQLLSKDTLSTQLAIAERARIPYAVILGQKEAIEDCVIVRNMETRSQESVPIKSLADHIKKKL